MVRLLVALLVFTSASIISKVFAQSINPDDIEIIRDEWGVPHIYASTDAEVAYGLAWAHSEDDFQTIQSTLLAGKQMLGRHLGKQGATIDYVVGLLDCQGVVDNELENLSEDFLALMRGYVQGINAYAAAHPGEVLVKKAFPITLNEAMRAYVLSLSVMLGADKTISQLFENKVTALWEHPKGSNAIAINRSKTADDHVYLAVNSHQPLEGPVSWYEAHLVSEEGWNAMGGLFPGGATIFHGTNEHLGWAHTVNYPDKIDVWQLEMHPKKKNVYKLDEEWKQLEQRKIKLKVKLFAGLKIGIKKKAYRSVYGPVVKNEKGVFAFDVAALHDLRTPEQWYRMNKARNFSEFKNAMEMMALPMFNVVYADKENHIFYVSNALLPKRNEGYDWAGVVPGNTSKTRYDGYYEFSELPQLLDPQSGFIYNTNHSPFFATADGDNIDSTLFDKNMGYKVWHNNRSWRFKELIQGYDALSYKDFLQIKYDVTLPDTLHYYLDLNPVFDMDLIEADSLHDYLSILKDWDRSAHTETVGAAQFIELYYHMNKKLGVEAPNTYRPTDQEVLDGMSAARNYFMSHFGKLNVTLGEYQQLVRGDKELPLKGMPDVLAAMYSSPHRDGRVKGTAGESYIMMIRYPKSGLPIVETVNVYGASNRTDSPHYDDQMELFVNGERKEMTMDIEQVRLSAERIYHPK